MKYNEIDNFTNGWEKVNNPEALRYYRQVQERKTTKPDKAWYRKWVGPFGLSLTKKFTSALTRANIKTENVFFDISGYVVVPKSALK